MAIEVPKQELKQQDVFKQMQTVAEETASKRLKDMMPKPAGALVLKQADLQAGVAKAMAVKTLSEMDRVATASGHKDVFGTGFGVKDIKEMRISKDNEVYSVRVERNGQELLLTLKTDKESTTLALTGKDGALYAYAEQRGDSITYGQRA